MLICRTVIRIRAPTSVEGSHCCAIPILFLCATAKKFICGAGALSLCEFSAILSEYDLRVNLIYFWRHFGS